MLRPSKVVTARAKATQQGEDKNAVVPAFRPRALQKGVLVCVCSTFICGAHGGALPVQ